MGIIMRAGTSTLKVKTKFDLSPFKVSIALKQNNILLTFDNELVKREIIQDTTYLRVRLTQEQTLKFVEKCDIQVQFKAYDNTNELVNVIPSTIGLINVGQILDAEVIEHGG